ncbi:MAG: alkaline phosphatase family protein [bacterium]
MYTIANLTPTVSSLMKLQGETSDSKRYLEAVLEKAKQMGITSVEKVLIYAPDALGVHLHKRFKSCFDKVGRIAPVSVEVQAVYPSKTPVCFATMFTGVLPEVHGICTYEKPVVKMQTLFDTAIASGKKVAIAAVAGSSIDLIFRERKIDYFSEQYDPQVTDRIQDLIKTGRHDLILAYHQEYDDMLHKTDPFSAEAIKAMENHISSFERLAKSFNYYWSEYNRLIIFAPDHGAHVDPATGKGYHGLDIPEDMEVVHYYGLYKKDSSKIFNKGL